MTAHIEILTGIAGSGKTDRLLEEYRTALQTALAQRRPGTTLWLTPTNGSRRVILERLLNASQPVCFAPNVLTFDAFAEQLLTAAGNENRPLTNVTRRLLIRNIVETLLQAGRLKYFAPIAHTSGFLDLVTAFISELKRSEVWPEHFIEACRTSGASEKDRELAGIYTAYQAQLISQKAYDTEGRFWSARDILKNGSRGPFHELSLVVVDGFSDFSHTLTQYELLEQLADIAERMLISLPGESPLNRHDLFAAPTTALERLQKLDTGQQPIVIQELTPHDAAKPAAFRQIASALFTSPRDIVPQADSEGIEVLTVTGQLGEVRALAERIKRWLSAGAAAEDIVVTLRSVSEYSELIEEVFAASGIPFVVEGGVPLARTPLLKALFAILRLELEGWPFDGLLGVIDSNYFRPNWQEWHQGAAARDAAFHLRRLKVDADRTAMLTALKRRADYEASVDADEQRKRRSTARPAGTAFALLDRLSQVLEPLRRKHTFAKWCQVLEVLANETGLSQPPENQAGSTTIDMLAARDADVWKQFQEVLREATAFGEQTNLAPTLDLPEFHSALLDVLSSEEFEDRTGGTILERELGCVRVLNASKVRQLDIPYLIVAGLTEAGFPQGRGDDCLYSESERRKLNRHGLSFKERSAQMQDEMLLFYGVVTRARRQLVLSYPSVSNSGQPLFPSPYLTALTDLFVPGSVRTTHAGRLDPVPHLHEVLTMGDFRIAAVDQTLKRDPAWFRALAEYPRTSATAHNILANVESSLARFHTTGFTPYEGRLTHQENITSLRLHYHDDYEFSTTQFESYAGCPFQFFLQNVLKLEPLESPAAATDYRARGTLVHEVLTIMYRQFIESDNDATEQNADAVAARFHTLVTEQLGRRVGESELQQALTAIEHEMLSRWAEAFGEQADEYTAAFEKLWLVPPMPVRLETPFGSPPVQQGDADAPEFPGLEFGEQQNPVRVRGRIDRIDAGNIDGQTVYNVIDYKTGSTSGFKLEDLRAGKALQLALYTLAVHRLGIVGEDATPYQMGYWSLREQGFHVGLKTKGKQKMGGLEAAVFAALEETLEDVVPKLAMGIRTGNFSVASQDKDCMRYCPYDTVCRIRQIRALTDKLQKRLEF